VAIAIVTGGDSGIGKATAVRLAADGWDVGITWHRDRDGAESTAEEIAGHGRRVEMRPLDLGCLPHAADVVDDLAGALDGIDALVNNAGIGRLRPFLDHSWEDWRATLSVDLDGAFLCAQHAARLMVQEGVRGTIVNVTSVHEHAPLEGLAAYCAAKGGLGMLTKVMALELAQHGIRVNSVAPGEIATPMTGQHDVDPSTVERPGIPLGRPGSAGEIANAIAWLVSPAASYVTGASFVIDGGLLLTAAEQG
jgi:NAD(P)-dependent dehydrogenase (short-subunit alcohol dehydrogenase family)